MDKREKFPFQKLLAAARGDSPPLVDVSDGVLNRIGIGTRRRDLLPWIFAAATSAAAAAIVAIAMRVLIARQDAGAALIDSIFSVIQ